MKTIITILLLISSAFGTCTFVGGTTLDSGGNLAPFDVAYAATSGNFVSIFATYYNNASTGNITAAVDNGGHSLTLDLDKAAALHDSLDQVYFSYTAPGATTKFTITYGGFAHVVATVSEFHCTGAVSLDVAATGQNFTGATPWFGQSITTTGANGIVLGGGFNIFGPDLAGTGSWSLASAGHDSGGSFFGGVVYQITSAAGAYQPSGTSVGNNNTTALSISYKEAGGGGNPAQHNLLTMGVGIAKLDPDTYLPLLGVGEAIVAGLPPVNNRGENDGLRQDNAVVSSVDALVRNSLLARDEHDDGVYSDAKIFALLYVHSANKFDLMGFSSPLVDWTQMVLRSDSLNGVVDWKKVSADLSDLVNFAAFSHWFDPRKATTEQMKAFLLDFAHVVDAYNRAG